MIKTCSLIFPHQLFANNPLIQQDSHLFLIEEDRFFVDFNFHKQKLVLHRSSMQAYFQQLKKRHTHTEYIAFYQTKKFYEQQLPDYKQLTIIDPIDHALEQKIKKLCKRYDISLEIIDSPGFVTDKSTFSQFFKNKKYFLMTSFYIAQRKRLNILVDKNQKPISGKWSYDKENRKILHKGTLIPKIHKPKKNIYIKQAIKYVEQHFPKNPGNAKKFWFPCTQGQAKNFLQDFLEHRLLHFGDYQDAIIQHQDVLFHSVLSPILNIGLLTPAYVIEKTIAYANKHKKITINNLEGFIRQIIGWREYMRAIYCLIGNKQRKANFWRHTKKCRRNFGMQQPILPL